MRSNLESQRRQYALSERALELGWNEATVIDDDLGRSGGGVDRPGFERRLAAICREEVGIVLSIEASRLARNGRDWHTLLEFCSLVGCLLADAEAVYDPRLPNDRLLLGMKGTLSEMELSILRQCSLEALRLKAQRGELFTCVAVGYVRVGRDAIAIDPSRRVREALALVFRRFEEPGSVHAVENWFRERKLELPTVPTPYGPQGRQVVWKRAAYHALHALLTNPVYAGAYAYGRTGSRTQIENGRKRVRRGLELPREQWQVLILEHHQGYIAWDSYERNQAVIADNRTRQPEARDAVRSGAALLAGLLRCGACGRKLAVHYSGRGGRVVRYDCRRGHANHGVAPCLSFGGLRVDRAVGRAVVDALQPLGVEAALLAVELRGREAGGVVRQAELALEAARYEAELALLRLENVQPRNHLVADDFEDRYNDRLADVRQLEERLSAARRRELERVTPAVREGYLALGADLERVWNSAHVTTATRKRILRAEVEEIVADVARNWIRLRIHWHCGDHPQLRVRKNRTGEHRWSTDAATGDLIRELARQLPDSGIAVLLNRLGRRTGRGNAWTRGRVQSYRASHGVKVYREGERRERGELTLEEAAERLSASPALARRLIADRIVAARHICKGAPWVIAGKALEGSRVAAAVAGAADPKQRRLRFGTPRAALSRCAPSKATPPTPPPSPSRSSTCASASGSSASRWWATAA